MRRIAAGADMRTQIGFGILQEGGSDHDEKERLSGVDAEIQNHAEQDNGQSVPVPDFPELALFLANPMGRC